MVEQYPPHMNEWCRGFEKDVYSGGFPVCSPTGKAVLLKGNSAALTTPVPCHIIDGFTCPT